MVDRYSRLRFVWVFGLLLLAACSGPSSGPSSVPEIISFTATPDDIAEAGQAVTLSWVVEGVVTGLEIDQGVGSVSGVEKVVYPDGPTTYTLTASNSRGSDETTVGVTVGGNAPEVPGNRDPVAVFTYEQVSADKSGVRIKFRGLDSTDPDSDELNFAWDFGDGSSAASGDYTKRYTEDGVYAVTLTVTDGRGGRSSQTQDLTIDVPGKAPPTDPTDPTTTTDPADPTETTDPTDPTTTTDPTDPTTTTDPTDPTTTTDPSDPTTTTDPTAPLPAPPVITSFSVTPETIEAGDDATLSWSVTGEVDMLTLNRGIGSVLGQTSLEVEPETTTIYTLTASNAGGSDSATVTLTVEEGEEDQEPIAVIEAPDSVGVLEAIKLDGSASSDPDGGEIVTYAWQVTGPLGLTTAFTGETVQFTASFPGDYQALLVVTDDEGVVSAPANKTVTAVIE